MTWQDKINKINQQDCLELMKEMPDKCVDMILCDLPYGTTACAWDTIIPFEIMWPEFKRIIKVGGAIVLSAAQPFTSALVMSNITQYKHHWIWLKEKGTGFQVAKYRPMMATEDIIAFGSKSFTIYNPQMTKRSKAIKYKYPVKKSKSNPLANYNAKTVESDVKYPENVLCYSTETGEHPTQKPVALWGYLIKTYSNENDLVFDGCMGSWTTAVACQQLKRNFIGAELSADYCDVGRQRLRQQVLL